MRSPEFTPLQLALCHPANRGPASMMARTLAKELEAYVGVTPVLAEGCRRGWDLAHDEPVKKQEGQS